MGLLSLLGSLFGGIGGAVGNVGSAFFSFKSAQAQVVQSAIQTIADVNASDSAKTQAICQTWAADASSDSVLTRCWRPLIILATFTMLFAWWFGFSPPHLQDALPPALDKLFDTALYLTGVGMGGRTLEKIMNNFSIGAVMKTLIDKKIT